MELDTSKWSGEGSFTELLIERLRTLDAIALVRVEDAPASRSEADYNFISNELFVVFMTKVRHERIRRFGILPGLRAVAEKEMTMAGLEQALTGLSDIGAPDYSDEGLLQSGILLFDELRQLHIRRQTTQRQDELPDSHAHKDSQGDQSHCPDS